MISLGFSALIIALYAELGDTQQDLCILVEFLTMINRDVQKTMNGIIFIIGILGILNGTISMKLRKMFGLQNKMLTMHLQDLMQFMIMDDCFSEMHLEDALMD